MSTATHARALSRVLVALRLGFAQPLLRWFGAGLLLALLGVPLLGPTPGSVARELPPAPDWRLPELALPDTAAIAERRTLAPLWLSQPQASASSAQDLPPPRLLAVFRDAQGDQAVFRRPDGSRQRLRPGESLPEGFELVELGATHARLRARDGRLFEQRLLGPPAALE